MNLRNKHLFVRVTILCAALTSVAAFAHSFKVADLEIAHPYAIASVQGQSNGGVFFKHIENKGGRSERMIAASIDPSIAERTELHTMNTENDIMRMRQIAAIELPAKKLVSMARGLKKDGYHVMLMNLKAPLKIGDKLAMKLTFEKAGTVEVVVNVEELKASTHAGHEKHVH